MARDGMRHDGAEKPRKRFNSWKQPGRPPSPDDDLESRSSSHGDSEKMTQRQRVNTIRCVDFHEYRQDYRARKYAGLTYKDKLRMFGTELMPIFVPLARGETLEMYEQRLCEWLWREYGEELDELQRHDNPFLERTRRIGFANANVNGDVVFDPHRVSYTPERRKRERSESQDRDYSSSRRKLERDEDRDTARYEPRSHYHPHDDNKDTERSHEPSSRYSQDDKRDEKRPKDSSSRKTEETKQPRPIRICDYEEPTGDASSTDALKLHLTCGCTSCLFAAMGKMDKKLVEIEAKYTPETAGAQVIDLT